MHLIILQRAILGNLVILLRRTRLCEGWLICQRFFIVGGKLGIYFLNELLLWLIVLNLTKSELREFMIYSVLLYLLHVLFDYGEVLPKAFVTPNVFNSIQRFSPELDYGIAFDWNTNICMRVRVFFSGWNFSSMTLMLLGYILNYVEQLCLIIFCRL